MSCEGNSYRQILRKYQNVLNKPTCLYNHFYSMCDVRDGFKTYAYYTNNDVEDVINHICLNWNFKIDFCF